jgi:hypothetical protein
LDVVAIVSGFDFVNGLTQTSEEPSVDSLEFGGLSGYRLDVHQDEAGRIPDLVAEVSRIFGLLVAVP